MKNTGQSQSNTMSKTHDFLKAKIQFGNSKGPITFNREVAVFHHDDIPPSKRERKEDILKYKSSKVLSSTKPGFVFEPMKHPPCERRTMENYKADRSSAYRFNHRAESIDSLKQSELIDKPTKFHVSAQLESTALALKELKKTNRIQAGHLKRSQLMPQHDREDTYEPWQYSTMLTPADRQKSLDAMNAKSKNWTSKVTRTVPKKTDYINPVESANKLQEEVRRQKSLGIFQTTKKVFMEPLAPVNRKELRNRCAVEPKKMRVTSKHSGVWERSRVDGRSMWSDTGANQFFSTGDIKIRSNLDAYIFTGPVTNRPIGVETKEN